MSFKVKLTKIKSNHSNLRTDVIEGVTFKLPEVGDSFSLFGEPLNLAFDCRAVYTTEIKVCERIGNEIQFTTVNSIYKLEVLEEIK